MTRAEALKLLGLDASATAEDIKQAYRRLAMKYHPDRNQGSKEAEERFKELQAAYTCLTSPAGAEPPPFSTTGSEGLDDLLARMASLFGWRGFPPGGGSAGSFTQRYPVMIEVALRAAIYGTELTVELPPNFGSEQLRVTIPPGSPPGALVCSHHVRSASQPTFVDIRLSLKCPTDVQVIWEEHHARALGVQPGDIIAPLEVNAVRLLLGGTVPYETPDGTQVELQLSPGTPGGQRLRLPRHGYWRPRWPGAAASRGDLYLSVVPQLVPLAALPPELRAELQRALAELAG
jgi:DnaJ-class molecular chaperone